MEKSIFVYLFFGALSIFSGVLYLANLSKRIKKTQRKGTSTLFDDSLNLKGYAGALCLIIIGVIIIVKQFR